MTAVDERRILEAFLDWGNLCDRPWPWRSIFTQTLRWALTSVPLVDVLAPEEREFFVGLPDPVPIWRGCERGLERGLSWTTDRKVAEEFARGKRHMNKQPTLIRAEIPKRQVFAVFVGRREHEVAADPRRLRRLERVELPPPPHADQSRSLAELWPGLFRSQ
jgi:hypothetical protein